MKKDNDSMQIAKATFEKAMFIGDIEIISQYARENEREFFAEVFAMYQRNNVLPDYMQKMIKEVMR
jgi:hypothetical protein